MTNTRAVLLLCSGLFAACTPASTVAPPPTPQTQVQPRADVIPRVIPEPVSLTPSSGAFALRDSASIVVESGNAEASRIADLLASILRPSTGFAVPISTSGASAPGAIILRLSTDAALGPEGYQLLVSPDSVRITANAPAGLFHGVQTLRQLLPPKIESHMKLSPMTWTVAAVRITDQPRYSWRGAMLDVARHFFTVREVKQYIDLLALYKMNVLHLHLADDQGWRIEIKSRPKLVSMGSITQVGGGPGGFYTQDEFRDIVRYAQERYITTVPEIDMPGHTNAALVGYPELSCSVESPGPYTGTKVGFSTLCANKEETYAFVDDVIREIAELTPGRYLHVGGDENPILSHEDYTKFVERTQDIVAKHGKLMVGWEEIARARLSPTTLAQAWATDTVAAAALKYGAKVILSPGKRTYLDMKYDANTELGLRWAALIEVRDAYDWDPATYMKGVAEPNIAGVEAALWSETVRNITAVEYLVMPRLPALAEVAWTPQSARSWDSFRQRLATHAPRWNFLGVNYYRSPQVPWAFQSDAAPVKTASTADDVRLRNDWPFLQKYAKANTELPAPAPGEQRVVFIGNSITESWTPYFASMFPGKPYINRGIGGQTTPQMLVRFHQDVVALKPKVVVILAGTNDIAGNTGPATLEMIENNLAAMAEMSKANGIRVVLSSVLPVYTYTWRPEVAQPWKTIVALNQWMKDYARSHGEVYLDYHTPMADERLGLRKDLTPDGVHPNEAGYRIMAPLAVSAIEEALGR